MNHLTTFLGSVFSGKVTELCNLLTYRLLPSHERDAGNYHCPSLPLLSHSLPSFMIHSLYHDTTPHHILTHTSPLHTNLLTSYQILSHCTLLLYPLNTLSHCTLSIHYCIPSQYPTLPYTVLTAFLHYTLQIPSQYPLDALSHYTLSILYTVLHCSISP